MLLTVQTTQINNKIELNLRRIVVICYEHHQIHQKPIEIHFLNTYTSIKVYYVIVNNGYARCRVYKQNKKSSSIFMMKCTLRDKFWDTGVDFEKCTF